MELTSGSYGSLDLPPLNGLTEASFSRNETQEAVLWIKR